MTASTVIIMYTVQNRRVCTEPTVMEVEKSTVSLCSSSAATQACLDFVQCFSHARDKKRSLLKKKSNAALFLAMTPLLRQKISAYPKGTVNEAHYIQRARRTLSLPTGIKEIWTATPSSSTIFFLLPNPPATRSSQKKRGGGDLGFDTQEVSPFTARQNCLSFLVARKRSLKIEEE